MLTDGEIQKLKVTKTLNYSNELQSNTFHNQASKNGKGKRNCEG